MLSRSGVQLHPPNPLKCLPLTPAEENPWGFPSSLLRSRSCFSVMFFALFSRHRVFGIADLEPCFCISGGSVTLRVRMIWSRAEWKSTLPRKGSSHIVGVAEGVCLLNVIGIRFRKQFREHEHAYCVRAHCTTKTKEGGAWWWTGDSTSLDCDDWPFSWDSLVKNNFCMWNAALARKQKDFTNLIKVAWLFESWWTPEPFCFAKSHESWEWFSQ